MMYSAKYKTIKSVLFLLTLLFSITSQATVVEFRTNVGNFEVNLFDQTTPETVRNFLEYVNSGAYANNVVHRAQRSFVVQAGGFQYNGSIPLDNVPAGTPVVNEPVLSNVRGTIAMAKLESDPNSATNQWFFNLVDNSSNLDVTNSGFTVFGQVIGDGMEVVDGIAAIQTFNLGGAANSIPLRNYTATDLTNDVDPTDEHFVIITDVVVTNADAVTNPSITPVRNTSNNGSGGGGGNDGGNSSSGGGGAFGLLLLFLPVLFIRKRT